MRADRAGPGPAHSRQISPGGPVRRVQGQASGQGRSDPALTEREFRRYLDCGTLAHGFTRARCADCGHDFIAAYS